MKRAGTNRGRLLKLAAVLAERLYETELCLGGPAFGSCCSHGPRVLSGRVTLPVNCFTPYIFSPSSLKILTNWYNNNNNNNNNNI